MKTALLKLPTIFLLITAVLLSNTFAQTSSGKWEKVAKLPVNTGLFIETTNTKTVKGFFISANEEGLKYNDKKGEKVLKKDEIKRVFYGIETERVSLWKRILLNTGVFIGIMMIAGKISVEVHPTGTVGEVTGDGMIGFIAATTGTALTDRGLKKLKKLTKGALIYEKN